MTMQKDLILRQQIVDLRSLHRDVQITERDAGIPRIPVKSNGTWYERYGKPVLDRALGVLLTLALSPVMLLIALAVLFRLGRPVMLSQPRVGRGGRPFDMLKFRTMEHDRRERQVPITEPDRRQTHKSPNDPRHTSLGRVLRRLSLDELPQLFNVIKGDMSFVGPRPELVNVAQHYELWQHDRHCVRPGLTGIWQTTARDIGLMRDHVHLDLSYIEQISLRTDLQLMGRTFHALVRPRTH